MVNHLGESSLLILHTVGEETPRELKLAPAVNQVVKLAQEELKRRKQRNAGVKRRVY